ncbi:hypothetical protein IT400_02845 [Candidatus Nomurabacteria bacterium]|nr:hypothetical protein [Candidatus Nomurabacteria bacterium]
MENPNFLNKKYQDLPGSKEASRAFAVARGKEKKEGSILADTKENRIIAYLSRLDAVAKDERGGELLKNKILNEYVTRYEEIPESYFENIIRDSGKLGDWNTYTPKQKEEEKRQNSEAVLDDQKSSLEEWVDYFKSDDSKDISNTLKYWIFRNLVKLGEYDKDKKEFPKRSRGTVLKFPDLNHESLRYVNDALINKFQGNSQEYEHDIQQEEREAFNKHLEKEDFAKLYAWATELMHPIPEHLLPITEGEWRKYQKNSSQRALVDSIKGKGTGWCTAGENTAKTQLKSGDFYVYYTKDDDQNSTIPRIAIRMEGDNIAEVRGIAYKQNLDPYMVNILKEKLEEFPDKEKYLKKEKDNKQLTTIDKKVKKGEDLNKEDLLFLYEINGPIDGFGYNKDPRIKEILKTRNIEEDQAIIFECTPDQIATNITEINENTKAYIGELVLGIFNKLSNMEYVYTKFPNNRIKQIEIKSNREYPNTADEWVKAYKEKDITLEDSTINEMLGKMEQTILPEGQKFVQLTVADLGFPDGATYENICNKATVMGLELCAQDDGPKLRLEYDQPTADYFRTAMKSIEISDGSLRLWDVDRSDGGARKLHWIYGKPSSGFLAVSSFSVFASNFELCTLEFRNELCYLELCSTKF